MVGREAYVPIEPREDHRDKRVGTSWLGPTVDEYNALDFVFGAIRTRARDVLDQVGGAAGDRDFIRTWTARCHLASELIVDFLENQTRLWAKYPSERTSLSFIGTWGGFLIVETQAAGDWRERNANVENLPYGFETLEHWLERARALHHDLQAHSRRRHRPTPIRWGEFARHCDWFVRLQVLGQSPTSIAQCDACDRAAVERGIARVARLLNVQRRRLQPGRPARNNL